MIRFKTIRYQNILSTGNQFTELQLDRAKSTLIVGENGAGKSTIIEALTFALFGKPYRDINKPQLVNTITNKNLLVELEFEVAGKEFMVRRGMKPNVFEIFQNGQSINQSAASKDFQEHFETNILKMNFKTFSQIVVLGSANYIPFMQLNAADRRKVIEDLLDIQIFSVMNSLLKEKVSNNKEALKAVDKEIDLLEQRIEMHNAHIEKMKTNNDALIAEKEAKIKEHADAIALHEINVEGMMSQVEELSNQIADSKTVSDRHSELVGMESKAESKIRKLKKEIQFYKDNENCPTCLQGIQPEFRETSIDNKTQKIDEFTTAMAKIEKQILKTEERLEFIHRTNEQIKKFNTAIQSNNQQINFLNRYISDLNAEIKRLREQEVEITSDIDITKYMTALSGYHDQKERLYKEKAVHDVAAVLLKDTGIKTKIVKQYIPIMNKLINKYLAAMDFFVDFQLDDSFNETIKSRYRDEFSYASFSEGEKLRIDLALMFTWRAIAKMRNSASTNLLIMDEIFDSSLDAAGTEEFLKILETLTQETNTFIISHKGDALFDKFHTVIRFEKNSNFSRIAA